MEIQVDVSVEKIEEGKYSLTYLMDHDGLNERLDYVRGKIKGLEQSIKSIYEQLAILKNEESQISSILGK